MTDKTEAMDNLIAQDADLIEICPDDLVQRLYTVLNNPTICREAADRIEAQAAEIERLRERVKRVENNNRELRGSKERVYAATDLRQPTQSEREMNAILTEEIEALTAEIERLNKSAECLAESRRLAVKDVAELEAENERLREALEFYAGWGVTNPVYDTVVILDGGKKARAALEQTK